MATTSGAVVVVGSEVVETYLDGNGVNDFFLFYGTTTTTISSV